MVGKRPYLPSFEQDRPSPSPVSSPSSACRRAIVGFQIASKEDRTRLPSLPMQRQTSLVSIYSLPSQPKGSHSYRADKPELALVVVDPPTTPTTTTTVTVTLAIPNPNQPLPFSQSEVEKKTRTEYLPQQSRAGISVARSIFDACMETKGLPSILSSSSSCFEESSCEHPARLDFLQSCFFCRRSLSMARDIYMYRGDRAFCSVDCRYNQIVIDERNERCSLISSMRNARSRTNTTMYTS